MRQHGHQRLRLSMAAGIASVSLLVNVAYAAEQNYPVKPIRIVTGGVGGQSDFAARLIAPGLIRELGQQVVVDNRASGVIPSEIVSKAAPDGYTLLLAGGTFTLGSLLQTTSFDPVRDFLPVTLTNRQPNLLVVHPSLPVKSVRELIDLAKAKPGVLNYSSGQAGSSSHLAAELFKYMAGVNIVGVHYRSGALRMTDLIGGQEQMEFATPGAVAPHVKSGKLREIAVTSLEPSALTPGVPTVAASGLPGYESVGMTGIVVPAKTPARIVSRLNQATRVVLSDAAVKQKFLDIGVETVGSSAEEYAAKIKAEITRMDKVIKGAGIRAE